MPESDSQQEILRTILHPTLRVAFQHDWYYPFELSKSDLKELGVRRAVEEGWSEWIETELDLEAVKNGYVFDLSRDKKGRPIYWHEGKWVRWTGGKRPKLVELPIENEDKFIGHIGAGDHFCRFVEAFLVHTKDPLADQPYRLLPWARKACQTIFGWVKREENEEHVAYRRFTDAIIEIPKKNAKSEVASCIAVYLVRADHTSKSYVYGCACDRNQAGIVYREAADFVRHSPYLRDEIQPVDSVKRFVHYESGSFFQVLSSDSNANDGLDAHGVIFDELHRQKTRKLFTVMKRAGRARRNKLRVVTTTYGETLKGIWGEEHLKAKAILAGKSRNWRKFVLIASAEPIDVIATEDVDAGYTRIPVSRLEQPIDSGEELEFTTSESGQSVKVKLASAAKRFQPFIEVEPVASDIPAFSESVANADWRTDHAIKRANPSVGVIFPIDEIRSDISDATNPLAEAEVKQLSLNILSGGGRKFISGAAWRACGKHRILPSELLGQRCYGGLDLSFVNDLSAFWLAFPSWHHTEKFAKVEKPIVRLVGLVWVVEDDIESREDQEEVAYRALASVPYCGQFTYVRLCAGSTINYQQMATDIVALTSRFKVQAVAYDPFASQFLIEPYLMPAGLRCIVHRQGSLSMGPATKRFDELVKRGCLAHGNHPVLDSAVDGAVLHTPDKAGNRYPSKDKSISRIDPLIAAIMATGWACDPPQECRGSGAWSGNGTGTWE